MLLCIMAYYLVASDPFHHQAESLRELHVWPPGVALSQQQDPPVSIIFFWRNAPCPAAKKKQRVWFRREIAQG